MNRFSGAAAAVVMCAGGVALAQRNFDNVQIKTTRVAGDIYMLTGSGGNIGVSAGEDGLIIIDDQYAPLAAKIKKALSEIKKGDPVFVKLIQCPTVDELKSNQSKKNKRSKVSVHSINPA